jgi:multiple sugar transport system permease protein
LYFQKGVEVRMKSKFSRKALREAGQGYFFMSPALFVLLLFILGPIFYIVFLSFHKVQLLGTTSFDFVAFENFTRILDDMRAQRALWNTLKYVVIVVPCQTLLAIVLAATLNAGLKGQTFFRIVFLFNCGFLTSGPCRRILRCISRGWAYN